ncbi:MAG: hypothetical protein WCK41_02595 [Actinomycetes bacterium]
MNHHGHDCPDTVFVADKYLRVLHPIALAPISYLVRPEITGGGHHL